MFEIDLARGKRGENIADQYLRQRQGAMDVFWVKGNYAEFDCIAIFPRGKLRTAEIKLDLRESETGNIAIEYLNRGKFSGILVSQADWYIIVLSDKLLCLKKRDLFYFLRENSFEERDWNGDKSQIVLVPTRELIASGLCDVWDLRTNKPIEPASDRLADYA